jgi:hypothetical protein
MKKIAVLILCLALIAGAGIYWYTQRQPAGNQYARTLPQEVVATVNLTNLATLTDGFSATALGRFLAKDTVHAVMQELGAEPKDLAEYDRLYDTMAEVMTNPAFRAVFGDDATVALLPPDTKQLADNPAEALKGALVVVARTSAAGALELFSRMAKTGSVGRETVEGLELTKITLEQNQVLYGTTEGKTVLLAYAPAMIKRCLAAGKGEQTLDRVPAFQQALSFWQPVPQERTYSRLYLNVGRMAELLATADNPEIRQSGEMLRGVEAMYSSSYGTDQGLESRARSTYRYDQLHELIRSAIDAASGANSTLHLLKDSTLAYNWASSLRPEMLIKALSANAEELQQVDAAVRQNLGVSLDELGRAIGPQYGGVLEDIVRTPLFPVPKLTLFVGIRDRKIAETVLTQLRQTINTTNMVSEEQEQVGGQTIHCWPVMPDPAAQPAVALTDTMLYLATSKQAIKEILEAKGAPNALAAPVATALGPELGERVRTANFGSFVLYPQRMARQTGEVMDWLGTILATKNISLSRLNREVVQLLRSTELIAATSNLTRERAEWTMTLKKGAEPAGAQGAAGNK